MTRGRIATRARLYLVIASVLSLAVALVVFALGWSAYVVRERTDELSRQAQAIARGMEASDAALGVAGSTGATLQERLFSVQARLIQAALYVTDEDGGVVVSSGPTQLESLPIGELRTSGDGVRTGVRAAQGGTRLLIVAVPVDLASGSWLVAAQPTSEVRNIGAAVVAVTLLGVFIATLVAWVAGGLLAERLTTPLVRLRDAAEAVARGAWGAQVPEDGDEEVVSLAKSFNNMSQRVAYTYAAQKAFVGDVSHELRTPITSIRGFSEAILDGTATDDEQVRRSASIIRDEALRMNSIAETLLSIAELDSGTVEINQVPVDLVVLASALKGRHSQSASASGLALEIEIAEHPQPIADTDRLLQAASALVANAIAYTPRGGTVRVCSEVTEGSWRLLVDDSGPGVPEERREHVFGRFSRLDVSRSKQEGGVGLGLAICRQLAELMGGRVWADDSPLGGARFVLELPFPVFDPASHSSA